MDTKINNDKDNEFNYHNIKNKYGHKNDKKMKLSYCFYGFLVMFIFFYFNVYGDINGVEYCSKYYNLFDVSNYLEVLFLCGLLLCYLTNNINKIYGKVYYCNIIVFLYNISIITNINCIFNKDLMITFYLFKHSLLYYMDYKLTELNAKKYFSYSLFLLFSYSLITILII